MNISVITLFPEMFKAISESGITRRAMERKLFSLNCVNLRDFTQDKHRTVDDRPFGGGPGMVMKAEPLFAAIDAAKMQHQSNAKVIYLSPQGKPLSHELVVDLGSNTDLVLLAGRYEGVDERVLNTIVDEEVSIGDYVLSGGELPAMVLIDALVRLLPGALGHQDSATMDSFAGELQGLLDCPHYTRPDSFEGMDVPAVLLSGDHEAIRRWRMKQSLGRTWLRRPDIFKAKQERGLTDEEKKLFKEFAAEQQ